MNCQPPLENIHIGSVTEAGCHAVPEEAWKEGIDDKAASFIFMPDIFGMVCPDWFCSDMFRSWSASWAKDEITRSPISGKYNPILRIHESQPVCFPLCAVLSFVVEFLKASTTKDTKVHKGENWFKKMSFRES